MAKVTFGDATLSGKLGSRVFAYNKAGFYDRQYRKPTDPSTGAQIDNRANFGSAVTAWHGLTDAQKGAWNIFAATVFKPKFPTLGVAYSGLRRRVFTSAIPPVARKNRSRATEETITKSLESILKARETSTEDYHQELHDAYHAGISLATVSKALGLSSSAPLYYAVQRHAMRMQEEKNE
jgi:hypothetical protein